MARLSEDQRTLYTEMMASAADLGADKKDATIERLRGQLQNCVNHLDRAKRKTYGLNLDECIESANRALYETSKRE